MPKRIRRLMDERRGIIKLGILLVNDICNANCSFCAGRQHRTRDNFNYKTFYNILNDNYSIEEITISGAGEPMTNILLVSNVLNTIKIASLPNLRKIKLYTNGLLLVDNVLELVGLKEEGLTDLYITMHSNDVEKNKLTLKTKLTPPTLEKISRIKDIVELNVRINIPLFDEGINTPEKLRIFVEEIESYGLSHASWVIRNDNDERYEKLKKVFNFKEPIYDETKQTLFPNGILTHKWCN